MKKQQATMRKDLLSMAFLATSLLSVNSQVVNDYGLLKTNGNKIISSKTNQPVAFAGNSFFWSNFQDVGGKFYTTDVVNFLVDEWETPIVRAAMGVDREDYAALLHPKGNRQTEINKIKTVVDAAIAKGIYVIIDFHSHFAFRPEGKAEAISFFREMAQTYGDNDHIIYEIFNEPIGPDGKNEEQDREQQNFWNNTIKPYANDVIKEIRKYDPDNLIIVGTPFFSQRVDLVIGNEVRDSGDNVAYTLHFYAATHKKGLRDIAQKALNANLPLFVTEWGTVDAKAQGSVDRQSTQEWVNFLKKNNISLVNWAIGDKGLNDKNELETASLVQEKQGIQGLLNNRLTESGIYVRELMADFNKDLTLSTENFNLNGEAISVYPNPAADRMTISTKNTSITSVKIIDMQGREVLKNNYKSTKATIDVSALSKGFYVLQLNNKTSRKIIIE